MGTNGNWEKMDVPGTKAMFSVDIFITYIDIYIYIISIFVYIILYIIHLYTYIYI